jgi:hypothetical protein
MATLKARFVPKFPAKYMGDATNIFARSSWELYAMRYFDQSPAILRWGSEELRIPYLKPYVDQLGNVRVRPATYYPDFIIEYRAKDGQVRKAIIEIKPVKEAVSERAKTNHDKLALVVNNAKWKAAEEFASRHGMVFQVLTERSLFASRPKAAKRQQPGLAKGPRLARGPRKQANDH